MILIRSMFSAFKNLEIKSLSKHCITQDEYVIIPYDYVFELQLDINSQTDNYEQFTQLDLEEIDKQSIILHKKYIHSLSICKMLGKKLNFWPTKELELEISYTYDSGKLMDYLNDPCISKIPTNVIFSLSYPGIASLNHNTKLRFDGLFDSLNVKKIILSRIRDESIVEDIC